MTANRTNTAQVKEVFVTSLTDPRLQALIDMAHRLCDGALSDKGLSESQLSDIEVYLSAHLAAVSDRTSLLAGNAEEIKVGESTMKFESSSFFGGRLNSTTYGQQAILLDTTGTLATLGKPRAQFRTV